ncbi:MAG: type VI secretion system ImpA family N-terminal domain-containing protein [Litoreibacter sp.]
MDILTLLEPVEGDNPSGAELRNDARFHALQRLLDTAAKKERVTPEGVLNSGATPTNWDQIASDGLELAASGRDLRLLVIMVRVAYAKSGFSGLLVGLEMLTLTLDQYWDDLHPALRDRDTPQAAALPRNNALKQLENDDNGLLGDLKFGIMLNPRGIGPILGHEIAIARMTVFEAQSNASGGLSQSELDAVAELHTKRVNRVNVAMAVLFGEEAERGAAMIKDLIGCENALKALCSSFALKGEFAEGTALTLSELTEFLRMVRATLEAVMSDPEPQSTTATSAATSVTPPISTWGSIDTRADVEKALDGIIAFYEHTEPSSPIPHLARRMRRMVPMNFLELMEEIAPSGMKEFRSVAGVEGAQKK